MSSEMERELERTIQMRGFRFGTHDFLAELRGVEALKAHNDSSEVNYLKKGLMDRKTKELVIIAACVAQKDHISHIQCHMWAAHKAGASPEEILELVELLSSWTGSVAKTCGLEAWRVLFRPDIPTVYRLERR